MAVTFKALQDIRVDEGIPWRGVTVFPLRGADLGGPEYVVGPDAIGDQLIRVKEVSEGGNVQEIRVENVSPHNVLLVEGETLIGAKQNRALNVTVLVGAQSEVSLPVSCVEAGRWRHTSRIFGSSPYQAHPKLRRIKSRHTSETLEAEAGFVGSQSAVWAEISEKEALFQKRSPSAAVHDLYDAMKEDLEQTVADLSRALEGARGMALVFDEGSVMVDLFDRSSTFERYRDRLLRAASFEALASREKKDEQQEVGRDRVNAFLERAATLPEARRRPSPGLGTDLRGRSDNVLSVALEFEETPLHTAAYTV